MKKFTTLVLVLFCAFLFVGCDLNSLIDQVDSQKTGELTNNPTENPTTDPSAAYSDPIQQELINRVAAVEETITEKTVFNLTLHNSVIMLDADKEVLLDSTFESEFVIDFTNYYMWEKFTVFGISTEFLMSQTDGKLYFHNIVDDIVVGSEVLADPASSAMFEETLEGQDAVLKLLPLPEEATFTKISNDEYHLVFPLSAVFDDQNFSEWIAPAGVFDKEAAAAITVVMNVKFGTDPSSIEMTMEILNVGIYPYDGATTNLSYRLLLSFPATYEPKVVEPYTPDLETE